MEKGLSTNFDTFGPTHEISFAYSFTPNLTEDRVLLEEQEDQLASVEERLNNLDDKDKEIEELKRNLAKNDAILAELMYRQDSLESIESNRQQDLERRFEMVMRMVRNETRGERPDLEERARQLYMGQDHKQPSHKMIKRRNPSGRMPFRIVPKAHVIRPGKRLKTLPPPHQKHVPQLQLQAQVLRAANSGICPE